MDNNHGQNRMPQHWGNVFQASGSAAVPFPWFMHGGQHPRFPICSQFTRGGGASLQTPQTQLFTLFQQRGFCPPSVGYHQQKECQLPRQWELTELGACYQANGDVLAAQGNSRHPVTFTVMSYNILAQDLINLNPDLYTFSSPESLNWEQRRCRLVAEIVYHNADILCLQEVQENHFYNDIKPKLETFGYTGCYQKRTGDKSDGCATMWKKDKFHVLRWTPVIYCRGGLLDRDNIALVVELQPLRCAQGAKETKHNPEDKVLIANTHLLFNPRRGDIKLAQLMILLAEIDKHAYLGPSLERQPPSSTTPTWDNMGAERYCPVIMAGDFNMEPHSDLYKFLITSALKYEGLITKEMSGQQESWRGGSNFLQRHFLSPMYGVTDLCQYHSVAVERLRQSYQSYNNASLSQSTDTAMGQSYKGQNDKQAAVGQGLQRENKNSAEKDCEKSPRSDCCAEGTVTDSDTVSVENCHCDHADRTEKRHSRKKDLPPLMPNSSGCLSHRLNLFSAYRHKVQRLGDVNEVTTHHSRAECTVDYIFYSVDYKDVCVKEEEVEVRVVEEGHLKLLGRYGLMSGEELDALGGIPNALVPSDHLCLITKFLLL
ncbi:protein angel homolog 2-like isoform X2 [Babylonia areolata]|uniref:protein angel homolog 2-like isoform X2 n=1 Tax=Babylonia areolata TaxID=304850 RepID=UPI003FCFFD81